LLVFLLGSLTYAETSMSEYQVKGLFLLNFAKYVDWPGDSPGPITIGILGEDHFGDNLKKLVEGKSINGHTIVIRHLSSIEDLDGCSILFVSSSEDSRLDRILVKTGTLPILTVGENESFLDKGGVINFALKEGTIHLEINLKAARQVKLQISSKLLSVADVRE